MSRQVEEEVGIKNGVPKKEFVNTKLMTRQTYTLEGISGTLDGGIFKEEDGIDYAATTVQLPGGERVPFLFSVKDLVAKTSSGPIKPGFGLSGSFTVPSYRQGTFLDPKVGSCPNHSLAYNFLLLDLFAYIITSPLSSMQYRPYRLINDALH